MNINTAPLFIASSVVVVIEDALLRLALLRRNHDRSFETALSTTSVSMTTFEDRPECLLRVQKSSDTRENSFNQNMNVMEQNRHFVERILKTLRKDLENNGEFVHFIQMINMELERDGQFYNKHITKARLNTQIQMGQEAISRFKQTTNIQRKELESVLRNLKHNQQELIHKKNMQIQLTKMQIQQKVEKIKVFCENEILSIINEISNCSKSLAKDKIAHKCYVESCRNIFADIIYNEDQFIKHFTTNKDKMMHLINSYTKNYKEQSITFQALLTKFKLYLITVEEDRVWKLELKKDEDILNYQIKKVSIIQNWWRYIIVRDNLLAKSRRKAKK